jgi:peptidoglycan glycosyltransferase
VRDKRSEVSLHQPGTLLRHVLSREAATQLNDMMMLSVNTAYASPAKIPNIRVGGQTPHSWFIGYAPANRSGVAVAVIMEHRGSGTKFATPAGRQVLQAALQLGY